MAAYAEGLGILNSANIGKVQSEADAETTPLRDPGRYQYDLNLADVSEVLAAWQRHRFLVARPHGYRARGGRNAFEIRRSRLGFRRRPVDDQSGD